MIGVLSFSILGGISLPALYNKFVKKYFVVGKYHFHHTIYALLLLFWSIFLFLEGKTLALYALGFGVGLMIHHWFSEKHLKLITKI